MPDRMYKQVARGLDVLAQDAGLHLFEVADRTAYLKGKRTRQYSEQLIAETVAKLVRSQSSALMHLSGAATDAAALKGNETNDQLAKLGARVLNAIGRMD